MLSSLSRAAATLSEGVIGVSTVGIRVPAGAAARVTDVVWTWWVERSDTVAQSAQQAKNNVITTRAATSRIVSAVHAMSTDDVVAKVEGTAAAQVAAPQTKVASASPAQPAAGWSLCRTRRSSWFCARRVRGCGRRRGVHSNSLRIVPDTMFANAEQESGGRTSPVDGARRTSSTMRFGQAGTDAAPLRHVSPRMMVYIKRRPVMGTKWSGALTKLGQDHVGVLVTPMTGLEARGGSVDVADPTAGATAMCASQPTTYDFGPCGYGTDFSIFKITDAEVRKDMFPEGDSAFVGVTSRTPEEIEAFNREYSAKRYHLGVSDCRDYTAALVHFTTGIRMEPGAIPYYVTRVQAQAKPGLTADKNAGRPATAQHTSMTEPTGVSAGAEDAHEAELSGWGGALWRLLGSSSSFPSMHSVICGARGPLYVGLGL